MSVHYSDQHIYGMCTWNSISAQIASIWSLRISAWSNPGRRACGDLAVGIAELQQPKGWANKRILVWTWHTTDTLLVKHLREWQKPGNFGVLKNYFRVSKVFGHIFVGPKIWRPEKCSDIQTKFVYGHSKCKVVQTTRPNISNVVSQALLKSMPRAWFSCYDLNLPTPVPLVVSLFPTFLCASDVGRAFWCSLEADRETNNLPSINVSPVTSHHVPWSQVTCRTVSQMPSCPFHPSVLKQFPELVA